jgi:hypothetical protein
LFGSEKFPTLKFLTKKVSFVKNRVPHLAFQNTFPQKNKFKKALHRKKRKYIKKQKRKE